MSHWINTGRVTARNIIDYTQNLLEPSIKLGVTGLSRSGKTVFITSLIYHLLKQENLKFFEPLANGRITKVYLEPHPNDLLPRFDYEGNLQQLNGATPTWPEGTKHLSLLRLTIEYQSNNFPKSLLGPSKQHIDILDYPGEWLLDLPLLEKDFQTWSDEAFRYANQPEYQALAKNWLEATKTLATNHHPQETSPNHEGQAKILNEAFCTFLTEARRSNPNLIGLPPGRFLMPGDLKGAPALTFAPLPLSQTQEIKPGTLAHLMLRRFEAYKNDVVRPFYRKFFTTLDRQIVLVDVLSSLNAGHKHLSHLESTLAEILKSFNPGAPHWLTSIWNKKIDKLIFAATKADQLHHSNHDQLQSLLAHITQKAIEKAEMHGAAVKVQALASLRTTKELNVEQAGTTYNALEGIPAKGERFQGATFDGEKQVIFFPGDLPENCSDILKNKTDIPHLDIINFRPPNSNDTETMPHIRLDRALNMLIGDKLT